MPGNHPAKKGEAVGKREGDRTSYIDKTFPLKPIVQETGSY